MISFVTAHTLAQPTSSAPVTVAFPGGNIALPLNTGSTPQIKDGPLLINANNVRTEFPYVSSSFGFSIIHGNAMGVNNGGVLLGNRDPETISTSSRPQFHIYKDPANLQRPAIRVEGAGPALVTPTQWTMIGIGTDPALNPEYTIDIPQGNPVMRIGGGTVPSGVSLQTSGTLQIMDTGNPFPIPLVDAYLQSVDADGTGSWTATGRPRIIPDPNMIPSSALHTIDESWGQGVNNNNYSTSNLEPGYWYITVFGTTGAAYSPNTTVTIEVSNNQMPTPDGRSFRIETPTHGTAPYSISLVVRVLPGNPGLNFSVNDNGGGGGINAPTINGISGYLIGS